MLYFFPNTVVPQFFLFLSSFGTGDDLGTVAFDRRPQATVLKSSPAPLVNSFDCSLNRHEITVYYLSCCNDEYLMTNEDKINR